MCCPDTPMANKKYFGHLLYIPSQARNKLIIRASWHRQTPCCAEKNLTITLWLYHIQTAFPTANFRWKPSAQWIIQSGGSFTYRSLSAETPAPFPFQRSGFIQFLQRSLNGGDTAWRFDATNWRKMVERDCLSSGKPLGRFHCQTIDLFALLW